MFVLRLACKFRRWLLLLSLRVLLEFCRVADVMRFPGNVRYVIIISGFVSFLISVSSVRLLIVSSSLIRCAGIWWIRFVHVISVYPTCYVLWTVVWLLSAFIALWVAVWVYFLYPTFLVYVSFCLWYSLMFICADSALIPLMLCLLSCSFKLLLLIILCIVLMGPIC